MSLPLRESLVNKINGGGKRKKSTTPQQGVEPVSPVRKPSIKAYYYESAQIKLLVDSMPGIVATRSLRFNCQAVVTKPSQFFKYLYDNLGI